MIKEMLYSVLQSTEEYLLTLGEKKKELRKKVRDLTSLEKISTEKGYQIDQLESDKINHELDLLETDEEIRRVKRVITRLKASLLILNGEEDQENVEQTEE